MKNKKQFTTVDEYIKTFPDDVQIILEKLRQTIRKTAPEAVETISYQIPAFKLNGRDLVYFAAWKNHISLYPIPSGTEAFMQKLSPYIKGKGTMQFPLNKPIPYYLVEKIVEFREKEAIAQNTTNR